MTATDADVIRAAELWGRDWPAGIFDIAAALAEARGEHGPRHCVSVDDANRVLSEERAAHERTATALAEAEAEAERRLDALIDVRAKRDALAAALAEARAEADQLRARAADELRAMAYRHPNGASPAKLNARADALTADDPMRGSARLCEATTRRRCEHHHHGWSTRPTEEEVAAISAAGTLSTDILRGISTGWRVLMDDASDGLRWLLGA